MGSGWKGIAAVLTVASGGLAAASAAPAPPSEARTNRLIRVYDWAGGYPWSFVTAIAQDSHGFLWIGATSGLYRFHGRSAMRVGGGDLYVASGGTEAGRVIVYDGFSRIFEATPSGLVRISDGVPETKTDWISTTVASDRTIWRVRDSTFERLPAGGTWEAVPLPLPADDPPRYVCNGRDGRVFLTSRRAVWIVEGSGPVRLLAPIERALNVLERADGSIVVGTNQDPGPITTRLFLVTGETSRPFYEERGARFLHMAERGEMLWVSTDRDLVALDRLGTARGIFAPPTAAVGGQLLVDREGSLWIATGRGLVQLPEPDVYAVQPSGGGIVRDIARTPRGIWGTFWGVLGFVEEGAPAPGMTVFSEPHFTAFCSDAAGRIWTSGGKGIQRLEADGTRGPSVASDPGFDLHSCGEGRDGRRWMVTGGQELWAIRPGDSLPRHVPIRLDLSDGLSGAAEDAGGTLWLSTGSRMCGAAASDVFDGREVDWRCEPVPGGRNLFDLQSTPSGDIWAITISGGPIRRRAGGRWEILAGADQLGTTFVSAIRPSPSGGVWVAGHGTLLRLAERLDLPQGWEILERPAAWNGMLTLNIVTVEEDPDGTLWLGTDLGIQRIPPDIRRRHAAPPSVELVEAFASGAPLDAGSPVHLPFRRNRLEVRFSAMTYRDPTAVSYRMRLRDTDGWSSPSTDGRFTFVDLPAGRYDLAVAASLDGQRWSETPARLTFDVPLPWYAKPWYLGGAGLGVVALGHFGYRLRVRRRLARERQRTRIAMDLHDEVGSGLGTIAVLAGIVGRPDLPEARRGDLAGRIAAVSQELARSLGDIVWSLRTSSGSLDALWNQLLERARPLFASGAPRVSFEAPDPVPPEPLALVVRRNLHLVAYEALHNAARHSGASVVTLRLARDGAGWKLEVEDDGRGLPEGAEAPPTVRRGLGLEAMRARAAEMDGRIAWDRGEAGGTRVTVWFGTGGD